MAVKCLLAAGQKDVRASAPNLRSVAVRRVGGVCQSHSADMDTLKKRSEFLAVAKGGRLGRRAFLVQGLQPASGAEPRIGYTVTKKTGNSVVRSRIKRRLRAAVAELTPQEIPQNADFVLVARDRALTLPFPKLVADLKSGLTQVLDPETPRGRGKPHKNSRSNHSTQRRKQG